eukprot:48780-Eustigmatos_ZCMA.PRE.1
MAAVAAVFNSLYRYLRRVYVHQSTPYVMWCLAVDVVDDNTAVAYHNMSKRYYFRLSYFLLQHHSTHHALRHEEVVARLLVEQALYKIRTTRPRV